MITDEQILAFSNRMQSVVDRFKTKGNRHDTTLISLEDLKLVMIREALEDYEESKWIDEKYAPKGVAVLVYGGVAMKKTGGGWYTEMETPLFKREIQWKVTKFQYLPTLPKGMMGNDYR